MRTIGIRTNRSWTRQLLVSTSALKTVMEASAVIQESSRSGSNELRPNIFFRELQLRITNQVSQPKRDLALRSFLCWSADGVGDGRSPTGCPTGSPTGSPTYIGINLIHRHCVRIAKFVKISFSESSFSAASKHIRTYQNDFLNSIAISTIFRTERVYRIILMVFPEFCNFSNSTNT